MWYSGSFFFLETCVWHFPHPLRLGVQVEEEQAACPSGSVIWNGAPGTSGWVYQGVWCFSCRNKDARGMGLGSSADDTVVLEVEYLTARHNSGCLVSFSTNAHRLSLFQSLL